MTTKKYKCPTCGKMNEKEDAVLKGKRYFCKECAEEKVEIEEKIVEEVKEVVVEQPKVEKPKVRQTIRFDMNDEVPVYSLVKRGKLIFEDHDKTIYEWNEFNEENYITIKGLLHMRNRHRGFFTEPLVRVDEDVAEFLKVPVAYQDLVDVDNIEDIFNLSEDDLKDTLIKSPIGVRGIIADTAIKMVEEGKLDSMRKIRIIEEVCKVEITEQSDRVFVLEKK